MHLPFFEKSINIPDLPAFEFLRFKGDTLAYFVPLIYVYIYMHVVLKLHKTWVYIYNYCICELENPKYLQKPFPLQEPFT